MFVLILVMITLMKEKDMTTKEVKKDTIMIMEMLMLITLITDLQWYGIFLLLMQSTEMRMQKEKITKEVTLQKDTMITRAMDMEADTDMELFLLKS